jgi:hypothetical protein
MKWVLCGLAFALAVVLAIATTAIRADNVHARERLAREWNCIVLRRMELQRLSVQSIERATPERLALNLRRLLEKRARQEAQVVQ